MGYMTTLGLRRRLQNEQTGEAGETGGGFDLDAAVSEIGAGLGFGEKSSEEAENTEETANNEIPPPPPSPTPAPTPAPTSAPAATPAPSQTPPPSRFTADAPPTTWNAAIAAQWAALPQPVREEIARRENDMFKGLEQYRNDAVVAKEIYKHLNPIREHLATQGVSVQQFVGNLTQAHLALANNGIPLEQRAEYAKQLLAQYGITLGDQPPAEEGFEAPEVKALREKITTLESRLNGADQRAANDLRAEQQRKIEAFASDPKNAYFDDVAEDIAALIRGSGGKMPLAEAYEKAVWANPVTRAKETSRLQAEAAEKAQKEAAERAAAARKASQGRVRTSGHQSGGTAASGSMDDTLQETLASIKKRGVS